MKKRKGLNVFIAIVIVSILIGIFITLTVNISIKRFQAIGEEKITPSKEALSLQGSFVEISNKVGPAVVNVSTEQVLKYRYFGYDFEDFFDRFFGEDESPFFKRKPKERIYKRQGLGTGMIITEDGYILTNYHVVKDVTKITIILSDKSKYEGKVVGVDKSHDLAVLKINVRKKLPVVILGNSDNVKVGEWAIAIGNPFGYDHTVTAGIVSAKGRLFEDVDEEGIRRIPNLIQTDAAINPGNSGGPLVNIYGEVIGINVAIVSTSGSYAGIGFAIPINDAKKFIDSTVKGKKFTSGTPWLGVRLQVLNEKLEKKFKVDSGVLITNVEEGSPAKKAGLLPGDIILQVDDKVIKTIDEILNVILSRNVGDTIKLKINRDGKELIIEVKLSSLEKYDELGSKYDIFGLKVENISPEYVDKYDLSVNEGVVVVDVKEGSDAYSVDIQEGDVILEVDKSKVRNINDYYNIISKINPKEGVLMRIKRKEVTIYVVINKSE